MKSIIELEKSLYKDIIVTLMVLLFSIPLWLNFDLASAKEVAQSYENYNYIDFEIMNNPTYNLEAVTDSYALATLETQDILIHNFSNTKSGYNLILKINKNVDTDKIKINVNYDVKYLNSYDKYDSGEYNVYIIDNDYLKAASRKYVISMWNDVSGKSFNKNIDFAFDVI